MLSINWSDVSKMVESIKVPLIVIGVALALAIIVSLAVFKMGKPARKLTRSTAWVAAFVAVVVAVVSMLYGGFKTVLDLAAGTGALTDASKAQVEELGNDISDEGMVLLKNQGGALPLAKGAALNVWGWGSTNPIYGGTGSGSLSKDNPTTTLLDGLHNAGFTTNDELTNLYTSYRAERPEVGMFKADWSLPEPTQDKYSEDLLSNATAFGDTAVVTIARSGGEGFDLPRDVNQEMADNPYFSYTNNSEEYTDFEDGQGYLELTRPEKDMIELAKKTGGIDKETLKTFTVLLAPFAPHIGEEIWQELGGTDSVFHAQWPECDEEAMKDDEISIGVQVNGKARGVVTIPADASKEVALAAAKEAVADKITGTIVKEIYVPGKIINIVCK